MPPEFSNDFCTPCEAIAWIWHKGNNPIGRRPIDIVDVVDVDLSDIHAVSLLSISNCPLTLSAAYNVPPLTAVP